MANARIIVIGGPTASGKSDVAATLAERMGGVVINADSMQLYGALPILSASPSAVLTRRVPHRLYGILEASAIASAAQWCLWARAEIVEALAKGLRPVVVGGTGLYIEALVEGLSEIPPIPETVRGQARADLRLMGNAAFHARLAAADPQSAHLPPGDSHRMLRAWEVLQATGLPLARFRSQRVRDDDWQFDCLAVVPPRATLYRACDERFRYMAGQGALEELAALDRAGGTDCPVMRTLGAAPLLRHLKGEIDLETAISLGQAATRHYAKRQTTWFRNRFLRHEGARIFSQPEQVLTAI